VLELPALTQASLITLFHVDGVGSIDAPSLTQLNGLSAFSCPLLNEVGLSLQSLPSQLYLQDNAALHLVAFPNLQQVASLYVVGSPELGSFTFPALTSVGAVTIGQTGLSNLDWLNPDLAGLLEAAGDMTFTYNAALPVCALDALGVALTAKGWDRLDLPARQFGVQFAVGRCANENIGLRGRFGRAGGPTGVSLQRRLEARTGAARAPRRLSGEQRLRCAAGLRFPKVSRRMRDDPRLRRQLALRRRSRSVARLPARRRVRVQDFGRLRVRARLRLRRQLSRFLPKRRRVYR